MKKRQQYEDFLSKVDILRELDTYERNSLCDILTSETYQPGQVIIRQGEQGDKFYLIEEGEAVAIKTKGTLI
jgi:cAMP-dependent protein kinase regulator